MISEYLYRKECDKALIQLGHHESDMLAEMAVDGWFDEKAYLARMDKSAYYITKNQRKIMAMCPQKNDDPDTASEKNFQRKLLVSEMAKHNKSGTSVPSRRRK